MLLFHVGTYFRNRLDTILVALAAANSVGIYYVSSELLRHAHERVGDSDGTCSLPAYAQLAGEPQALRAAFRAVLGFFFTVVMPICAGTVVVAPFLVRVVLGERWADAGPLVSMLTFAGGFNAISHVIGTSHAAHGSEGFRHTGVE